LKIWRGEEYHKRGLKQLADYLDIQNLDRGYLVVYNFNKSKEYKSEMVFVDGKEIFMIYV
ncbi:MAG: AAA family ATPase, partial [Clostridium sp.]